MSNDVATSSPPRVHPPPDLEATRALLAENPILGFTESEQVSWRMRPDDRRILLYELSHDTYGVDKVHRIHPAVAVILAVLHGERYRDACSHAAQLFERTFDDMDSWLTANLAGWMQRGAIETKSPGRSVTPLDPSRYALPADTVDLTRWWLYRPIGISIKVTDACQRNCRYCSVERRKDHPSLSTETWLRVLEDAVGSGVVSVSLVGGDPLLHHGLPEMIRYLTGNGIRPFISTKVFVTEKMAARLRDAGLDRIQISIDTDVEAIEDYMVDSPGAAGQLLASIENCRRAGMTVRTNTVITPYNALLFPDLVAHLHELGVTSMGTSQCGYSVFAGGIEDFLPRAAEGQWLEGEIKKLRAGGIEARFSYATEQQRRENFANRSWCTAGAWALIVNSNGAATLCDELPIEAPFVVGNVLESKILDIWESGEANRFRMPERDLFEGTACAGCEDFDACSRFPRICFRDAYYAYGRAFAPPPYCPRAPRALVRTSY